MGQLNVPLLSDILGLVLEKVPSHEELAKLSSEEVKEVVAWAGFVHAEAGDNNVLAGEAPACLLKLLPPEHYLHGWRQGQRNNEFGVCEWGSEDDMCPENAIGVWDTQLGEMNLCQKHAEAEADGLRGAEEI